MFVCVFLFIYYYSWYSYHFHHHLHHHHHRYLLIPNCTPSSLYLPILYKGLFVQCLLITLFIALDVHLLSSWIFYMLVLVIVSALSQWFEQRHYKAKENQRKQVHANKTLKHRTMKEQLSVRDIWTTMKELKKSQKHMNNEIKKSQEHMKETKKSQKHMTNVRNPMNIWTTRKQRKPRNE